MLPLPQNARSSLIIVDMQDFFFRDAARGRNLEQVVKNINLLIEYFDARSWPVFHILSGSKRMLGLGSHEAKIVPGIKISEDHQTIIKTRYSAFFKTNLAEILQAQKIHRVVVVGAYSHYCVNATIFDAYCYGFVPCIITDAVISHIPDKAEIRIARMQRNGYHLFSTQALIAAEPGN